MRLSTGGFRLFLLTSIAALVPLHAAAQTRGAAAAAAGLRLSRPRQYFVVSSQWSL
jgi:hypothetical protein